MPLTACGDCRSVIPSTETFFEGLDLRGEDREGEATLFERAVEEEGAEAVDGIPFFTASVTKTLDL